MSKITRLNISNIPLLVVGIVTSAVVVVVAFMAWGEGNRWQFSHLSIYQIFPFFGIAAFSLMWSQYVINGLSHAAPSKKEALTMYFKVTGTLVLLAIVLHPGLLIWQLWHDGFGLPPQSYLRHYVPSDMAWAALLGSVSLLIFLTYELRRIFRKYRWWRFMIYLSDAAMVAIFFHALALGSQLQLGWFRAIWFFYGITLLVILVYLRIFLPLKNAAQST